MGCVVITGSAKGFGFCQAKKFKELGQNVVISDIDEQALKNALEELEKINKECTKVIAIKCYVTKFNEIENLFDEASKNFKQVDIWVNNAGVNQPNKPVYELTEKEINFMLDVDLKGAIYGSRVAFDRMLKQGCGQIYNVEGYGSNDAMMMGLSLYGTTKRAITYFTLALAKESEDTSKGQIKVCRLTPGIMITDFIKTANGGNTKIELSEKTKKVYNILGDYPETIVSYVVPKMLKNKKNNAQIVWLTGRKAFARFMLAGFNKRDFFKEK